MTNIRITERLEQPTAAVREQVPVAELPAFFARAFQDTTAVLQEQGLQPAGPPFGKYYGQPTPLVDVEAGFPVSAPITPAGSVIPGHLPGGRILEAIHVGPYDTLERTYSAIQRYFSENNLVPGEVMWDSYLSDPELQPDPGQGRTQVCWPIG